MVKNCFLLENFIRLSKSAEEFIKWIENESLVLQVDAWLEDFNTLCCLLYNTTISFKNYYGIYLKIKRPKTLFFNLLNVQNDEIWQVARSVS